MRSNKEKCFLLVVLDQGVIVQFKGIQVRTPASFEFGSLREALEFAVTNRFCNFVMTDNSIDVSSLFPIQQSERINIRNLESVTSSLEESFLLRKVSLEVSEVKEISKRVLELLSSERAKELNDSSLPETSLSKAENEKELEFLDSVFDVSSLHIPEIDTSDLVLVARNKRRDPETTTK